MIEHSIFYQDMEKTEENKDILEKSGKDCSHRKHTAIVTEKQKRFFGAEMSRAKKGKKTKSGMSKKVLSRHLKESKGKELPEKVKKEE